MSFAWNFVDYRTDRKRTSNSDIHRTLFRDVEGSFEIDERWRVSIIFLGHFEDLLHGENQINKVQ